MTSRPWLIEKSALVRLDQSPDADEWARRIERGLVRITTVTLLETGYSARSAGDFVRLLRRPPVSLMPVQNMTPAMERRAIDVLHTLALRGRHRAPSIADLLIAAVAEQARLVVLHMDKDFELISEVTGQPVERLW